MLSYVFILVLVTSLVMAEFYSSRYDDFDIQPLLENDRILLGYTKCFLDQGPCTAEAKDFKKAIPESVETTCGKCTPKQKQLIREVIRAVMTNHPEAWKQLVDKYDKDYQYRGSFNEFIQSND
ncbi:ejaculatory bulb-specific protein 3 [Bicyclus anynana]|uniref:Ejaculatory bulb-specific protein 3 n=1 Tax=Bicyclus anynana TaxID=110368 RepID=A0ABM3LXI2_BICAN|nr:ejaculatory bulb-specific protein 3 [Bicyclus anynana]